jgi:hypothetical protein
MTASSTGTAVPAAGAALEGAPGGASASGVTPERAKVAVVLGAFVALAGAVAVLGVAAPDDARPLMIALGGIVALVLFAHLLTREPTDVSPVLMIAGLGLVLASLGVGVAAAAAASVLLLVAAELAAVRSLLARVPDDAVVDVAGRLRDCGATVLVGAAVAGVAAVGSLVDVPGRLAAVALAAVAVAALGKAIATFARA